MKASLARMVEPANRVTRQTNTTVLVRVISSGSTVNTVSEDFH